MENTDMFGKVVAVDTFINWFSVIESEPIDLSVPIRSMDIDLFEEIYGIYGMDANEKGETS